MIDWNLISEFEGNSLSGMVPDAQKSNSGVTVASGVDLGQFKVHDLLTFPEELEKKIAPYIGLHGMAAAEFVASHPLTITAADAALLNQHDRRETLLELLIHYQHFAGIPFDSLLDAVQTVMASVAFQYGDVWKRCPNFWTACCARNWPRVISILKNFGDRYTTRRTREAAYLASQLHIT